MSYDSSDTDGDNPETARNKAKPTENAEVSNAETPMDVTSLTPGIKVAKDGGEVGDNSDDKASDVYEYEGDQVFYTDPSTKGKSPDAKLYLRYSLGTRENTLTFLRLGWHVMIRLLLHLFIHNYEFLHIMLHIMLTSL